MKKLFKIIIKLTRIKIAVFSMLSAALGFILASGTVSINIILPTVGVFLLACGSSALNQYQERKTDALMERTKERPVPSGMIKPATALIFSTLLILSGLAVLSLPANMSVMLLSLFAVVWYNGVYTYLKKKSAFAVIPGALIGSIPPLIGWSAGGGEILNPQILAVAFFFFIWQVPHFWLLILNHGKDYEEAGLPSLTGVFSEVPLKIITFNWISATVVTCLLIPLFGVTKSVPLTLLLLASGTWLIFCALKLFKTSEKVNLLNATFKKINIYVLLVISLLSLGRLLKG